MLRYGFLFLLVGVTIPAWAWKWNAKRDWRAIGDGETDDSRAIQRGVAAMRSGDSVVFPAPGTYFVASTVNFRAPGIRLKCEPGAPLVGPNRGTDIFANLRPDTAIGGSATMGCIFRGGGIQAYGRGADGGQTLDQTVFNLMFTYNTFEDMTYGPNHFRSNGGVFIGGGSNHVVIRHNTFSNIMPYDNGYNAAGRTYLEQYDPDGDTARAAIWLYGGSNYSIDHNTFLHNYQNIKACEGQQFQADYILIHHNFSDSHHRMFIEINTGNGFGNPTHDAGICNFQVYDDYAKAGDPYPEANTFGLSEPFAQAKQPGSTVYTSTPMGRVAWDNNLLKAVVKKTEHVGIGFEVGARDMKISNNTVMSQWPIAGYGFGGTVGGSLQENYACLITPSRAKTAYFGGSNGKGTTAYLRNRIGGNCAPDLRPLAISLGPVSNASCVLTATATIEMVEFGTQGVVFAVDGRYVSAVMGAGPYTLNYGAAGLAGGAHRVTATVIDAVCLLAVSNKQSVSTSGGSCRPSQSKR